MCPVAPDRPDRVNNKSGRQMMAARNFSFAGPTAAECPAFREQFTAGNAVNCPVDSATTEKCRVCRVHYGVHFELRDVAADALDRAFRIFLLHCSSNNDEARMVK